MGKKDRSVEIEDLEQVKWYQWEFLRRNPEYHRENEAFLARFGVWFHEKGFWYDRDAVYEGKDWKLFCKVIAPRARQICRKWRICDPFPPDWDFDQQTGLHEYKPGLTAYLPTGYSSERAAACWELPLETLDHLVKKAAQEELEAVRLSDPDQEDFYRYVRSKLDVRRPLRELLEQVKKEVEFGKRRYEKFLLREGKEMPKTQSEKRRRLDTYQRYLQVWDLHQQGLTFARIAQQIYSGQSEARQRVVDQYKRAGELIQGDYKDLR